MQTRFFAAGIRWHFPGRSPLGGDYEGTGQVLDWLGRDFRASDETIRIELHDVIGNDEHVVALTTLRAERAGRHLQDNTVQIFHLQDGKATEVWTHPADLYTSDDFWGTVALVDRGWLETGAVLSSGSSSVFGFRFPREVISVAVRWYLRYGLSYRDVEELLAERGVTVDHVSVYRWVQRFTLEFIEAARPCRHAPGDRWFVDETYLKVAGQWAYLYRAVDQHGQVIDVLLSARRDLAAARRFFTRALRAGTVPAEVTTDRAPAYPRVLDELVPSALHTVERYATNPIEADHGRLKARLRPMRGLKRHRSARVLAAGHAFVQNLRRGHYDIATDVPGHHRLRKVFDDLAITV